jgi:adenylate cyclase 10
MEEWTIYFGFTRAKAIYDEFVQNFGKIQFPIGTHLDHYDQSVKMDINNLMRIKISK